MGTPIDVHTRFVQGADSLAAEISATEVVVLGADRQNYYGVNEVATRIWNLLEAPASAYEITTKLVEEYDIDTDTCLKSVLTVLGEMLDEQLVQACD